jgi:Grx4 family monothiol glutaredoxin
MAILTEITSKAALQAHRAELSPAVLLVIYYHKADDPSCEALSSAIAQIAAEHEASGPGELLSIASVDVSTARNATDQSEKYGISTLPYIVFLRDRKLRQAMPGFDPQKLRNALDRQLAAAAAPPPEPSKPKIAPELSLANVVSPNQFRNEPLDTRLAKLTRSAPVVAFIKGTPQSPACRFSRRMVKLLVEHEVRYDSFNILADEDVRQSLKEFGKWPTFPQLWVNGELAGGLDVVSFYSHPLQS